ncbi:protein NYNRIN-like, partial [Chelydra serpentina]
MDQHAFLLSPHSPVNLLGRDLLCKLGCTIYCTPDGVFLEVPDENTNLVLATLQTKELAQTNTALNSDLANLLSQVPACLWSQHANEVGEIQNAEPVKILVDPSKPLPRVPQYPLRPDAEKGIAPVIESLLKQGIVVPVISSCNTPIFPVKKPGKNTYRFVQDLRAVNAVVLPSYPVVPNLATILSCIPYTATYFTVVDLCSAFFSIPIHPESQYLFAFTYKGCQYTWTRLFQEYTESPSLFSQILKKDLDDVFFPGKSALIKYVDDLLLASPSYDSCKTDTMVLLTALALKGHKASQEKLQLCQSKVHYLGHDISSGFHHLSDPRITAILKLPRPVTVAQMRTFLGMTGYCRQWILGYATIIKPLQELSKLDTPEPLVWSQEAEQAFITIKQALSSAPALGLPDYTKPFILFCHERNGFALAVLTQKHGDKHHPLAYYSTALDPVAIGFPPYLKATAAAALETQHLSTSRLTKYELVLLSSSHITLARCPILNPASLLPGPQDGEAHDCISITSLLARPREDLTDVPLQNPNLIYFVDGSCLRNSEGKLVAGYAVCSSYSVIESAFLPSVFSAQVAELIALTRACILAQDQTVTIYTDSRYAFGVAHDYGVLWKYRGFLTSAGSPIKNGQYVSALLDALLLPKAIAIVKCIAHQTPHDEVTRGNALADLTTKDVA